MKNSTAFVLIAVLLLFGLSNRSTPIPWPVPVVVDEKPLIDGDGLHVLIVEEKDERRNLPSGQVAILTPSSQLVGWLKDNQGQWRRFDDDDNTAHDEPKWQAALKLPRESVPWIYVSHKGKGTFSGPLPPTVAATIELLGKYK